MMRVLASHMQVKGVKEHADGFEDGQFRLRFADACQ